MNIEELENKAKNLSDLCKLINPYEKLSKDTRDELFNLGIVNFEDPFSITNELLILMEELEEKIKTVKKDIH